MWLLSQAAKVPSDDSSNSKTEQTFESPKSDDADESILNFAELVNDSYDVIGGEFLTCHSDSPTDFNTAQIDCCKKAKVGYALSGDESISWLLCRSFPVADTATNLTATGKPKNGENPKAFGVIISYLEAP